MVLGIFDDPSRQIMASTLDACAIDNRIIANNIANADTPGYKRSYVRFDDTLKQLLKEGTPQDIQDAENLQATVAVDQTPSTRLDGNNVNLDMEMAEMARNGIKYNALVEMYDMRTQMFSTVITGAPK